MVERFSIGVSAAQLGERFEVEMPQMFQSRYNVAPSQLIPVITHEDPMGFSFFYWGQPPGWSKNKTLAERWISNLNTRLKVASRELSAYVLLVSPWPLTIHCFGV